MNEQEMQAAAELAMEKRAALMERRQQIQNDPTMSDAEKRAAFNSIDARITALADEADKYVQELERAAEVRKLNARAARLTSGTGGYGNGKPEWRGLLPSRTEHTERRVASTTSHADLAPTEVSKRLVDLLVAESRFLSIMDARGSVLRYSSTDLAIPQLTAEGNAAIVAENAEISATDDTYDSLPVGTLKVAVMRRASNEILEDSQLDLRNLLAKSMGRRAAVLYDGEAFGAGNGTSAVKGLTASGQSTGITLSSGRTVMDWEGILEAVSAVEDTDATPDVVFLSTGAAQALRSAREDGTSGGWLGMPSELRDITFVTSSRVPAGKAIVLASDRVIVPVRSDVRYFMSEHRYAEYDQVMFRLTWRVGAEIVIPEATSVQVITPAAS